MKSWEIFRFELAYQLRRPWTWACLAVLVVFAFLATRIGIVPVTLPQDFILNSPFIITSVTVFSCQIWLLIAPMVAGEAAARDVATGMHPLMYTTPLRKAQYLGGRFLAAVAVQAFILLGVQLGSLLAVYAPGGNPDIVGPFRPAAYLAAYSFIALTNAFIATTFQFSAALVGGRPIAAYVGSIALFFLSYPVTFALYFSPLQRTALLADPIGVMAIMNEMMSRWTIVEKNVRMFVLEGPMLANRLLWLGIATAAFGIVFWWFRFVHRTVTDPLAWLAKRFVPRATTTDRTEAVSVVIPQARRSFDLGTHLRQVASIAWSSCWMLVKSPAGLFLLLVFPAFVAFVLLTQTEQWSVPLLPRTELILSKYLTSPLTEFSDFRVMVPLLIAYFAGELVWRERDAGLAENIDTTPVPEGVLFAGKFSGLALLLLSYLVSVAVAGVSAQSLRGYHDYQLGRYAQILLGLQLPEYLLFAVLAFLFQVVANQKYLGLLFTLLAYVLIIFAGFFGIEHKLLVYTSGPEWYFTDMRGFGGSVGPWLWFKSYWAAWALLLVVGTLLLWARGRDDGFGARLRLARIRFTRAPATLAVLATGLIVVLGGFLFYNTNVLNEYVTDSELVDRRAEYERLYGRYEGIPQPQRAATSLRIEIYPREQSATIHGTYRLVNRAAVPIDSIHLEPAFGVKTSVSFDRPFRQVLADPKLGHDIYALARPLQPGDSVTLSFDVRFAPNGVRTRGLGRTGAGKAIVENGTHFDGGAMPLIGYQPIRELWSAEDRRKYGLPRQITLPEPADIDPRELSEPPATFEAVIGTDSGQIAVAPGVLRRSWSGGGRDYFQYVSDVPIGGTEMFFSARYALHRETLALGSGRQVDLQVFVHPGHQQILERLLKGVRASLEYYSTQFGPYPYDFLQFIEQPGNFLGMGVDGSGVITGGEGIFQLNPSGDGIDVVFETVGHEVAHQWWGMQLRTGWAEGGGVISEGLAWYSSMEMVKQVKGRERLRQLMSFMREPSPWPPIRTGLPLLRAIDPWANYRKAPYAMHALSEYVGEARVNQALRALIRTKNGSPATTLDLFRELQTVTPDSLRPLLHDLFEVDAYWTFDTKNVIASPGDSGRWDVTFEVDAHKIVADSAGKETEVPVAEWVELGVFAPAQPGERLGKTLYLRMHRIRSGTQRITVTVPEQPARAGIDPYNLLDWEEGDNIEGVEING